MKLTHFSLFSGIGGIDLSAEWAGFTTVGQCEIDEYATKVLEKNFPSVERWRDIHDVTIQSFQRRTGIGTGELTLLSGGFPCQPHSLAGNRKASSDERDLWGEFARVIREIKPKWVLAENVPGLRSSENGRFFGRILRDMAKMGYNVGWCSYGAVDVGALHKRERVFIVANTAGNIISNADSLGHEPQQPEQHIPQGESAFVESGGNVPYADNRSGIMRRNRALSAVGEIERVRTDHGGRTPEYGATRRRTTEPGLGKPFDGLSGGLDKSINPWQVDWEKDVPRIATGIENKNNRLKCLGNAVVPQQVYPILVEIANIEINRQK